MTCNIQDIFTRGGRERLRLLQYSVVSVRLDVLFVYLAKCFKTKPTSARAIALFDVFFGPEALAKLSVPEAIPPRNLQLGVEIDKLRQSIADFERMQAEDPEEAVPPLLPAIYLFDRPVELVVAGAQLAEVERDFDPQLDAIENLPGGKMTPGQRSFVSQTWVPSIRPVLVGAGFYDVASLGAD